MFAAQLSVIMFGCPSPATLNSTTGHGTRTVDGLNSFFMSCDNKLVVNESVV